MNLRRTLIEGLPDGLKRLAAVPYDRFQTYRADRAFRERSPTRREPAADAPEHVVWVVVDALRGDHVTEEVAPFMHSMAGTTDALAPATWTFPAVTSMLTGQYPHTHGAMHDPENRTENGFTVPGTLPTDRPTLTDVFAGAGYRTAGVFGHDTPFVALSGRFHDHSLFHQVNADAEDVLAAYRRWHGRQSGPTFGFVHLADPHIPVRPPRAYRRAFDVADIDGLAEWAYTDEETDETAERFREHRRRLYRASVNYVDDCLRAFRERLPDGVSMLVTADHGESMWERTDLAHRLFGGAGVVGHGGPPYEPLARVPLLVDGELERLRFDGGPVSLLDLVPTTLELLGLPDALGTEGYSLTEPTPADRTPLVEATMNGPEVKAVYTGDWKLLVGDGERVGLSLPDETEADLPAPVAERLEAALPAFSGGGGNTEVSGLVEDRLADLGYR
jgi:arylsulfatase A-like enzyme